MIQPTNMIEAQGIEQTADDEPEVENKMKDDLDKDAFFKLLTTQLKNQDPLEPMENREFISQMAQFTSLEQMQQMNGNMDQFLEMQNLTESAALIGKTVEVETGEDEEASTITGEVEQVSFDGDNIMAVLKNGEEVNLKDINRIA
ncbi:MAG: flagellar hook assembly protein FlgD [Halanaerobiales bacterium]